ncbi:GNAT family N-acetyltransferase [Jannaschia sp. S6380]|uniref:GNAT family N-acetyltransferase n=1 Tax=Jannaschia sp. S6380 TaxID=2926408 RepID=UPI0032B152E4
MRSEIAFVRLSEIAPAEIADHMSDPRVAEHMPLLTAAWDEAAAAKFVAMKEACWARDGLGHWAFLADGRYVGWGGFQREGDEWDFGLVLRPDAFGLGRRISGKAIDFAVADARIPFVTFLLPPSRKNLGALRKIGAQSLGEIEYDGAKFLKFRLETESADLRTSAQCVHSGT